MWRYDSDHNTVDEPCPPCLPNDYRYLSSGCKSTLAHTVSRYFCGQRRVLTAGLNQITRLWRADRSSRAWSGGCWEERAALPARTAAGRRRNGNYTAVPHTKVTVPATGPPLSLPTPAAAEAKCNGEDDSALFTITNS